MGGNAQDADTATEAMTTELNNMDSTGLGFMKDYRTKGNIRMLKE